MGKKGSSKKRGKLIRKKTLFFKKDMTF